MKLRAVVIVGGVLAACGGKEPAPAPPPSNVAAVPDAGPPDAPPLDEAEAAIAMMASFANDMCKCIDKACADAVQGRMTKWSTDMASSARDDRKRTPAPDERVMKQMTEIGQRYGECMMKAYSAGSSSGTP